MTALTKSEPERPLLELHGLRKNYGAVQALGGIDLKIHEGELSGVIGPNGSGKSTMFDCCTGLQPPGGGRVLLAGVDITGWPMNRIARQGRLLRSFQKTVVFETMTPEENLVAAGQMFAFSRVLPTFSIGPTARRRIAKLRSRASELVDRVGLTPVRAQPAGNLSIGQQKLLQFASMLITEPRLVLLDEPLAGINPVLIERIVELIQSANRELGITFLVIEHNIDVLMNLCRRVIVLDQGAIIEDGEPDKVVRSERVREAYLGG